MAVVKQRKPVLCDVPVKDLKLDKAIQLRCFLNRIAICDYAEAMERGEKFPPVVVFWVPGHTPRYVADGFHRVLAARRAGKKTIKCSVRVGTRRDAILYAAGANRSHGVRRTPEDKRKTVLAFLGDKEWCQWTDTVIARHAGVSTAMVAKYRAFLGEKAKGDISGSNGHERENRVYTDKNGETRFWSRPIKEDTQLEEKVKLNVCPYCGGRMRGKKPGPRGLGETKRREAKQC